LTSEPREAVHRLYTARRDDRGRIRSNPITALDIRGRGRVLTNFTDQHTITLSSGTPRMSSGTPRTIIKLFNDLHAQLG
jgi:hypothetical protein